MPAGSMDALGAFSHLSDNLPTWINRLSDLAAHTAAKNAEYAEAYKKLAVAPGEPRRRKNSSICSIRTDELRNTVTQPQPVPTQPTTETPSPQQAPSQNPPTHNPRKRGSDEAPSIDSKENAFVSTRYNLVIHYDGDTQKSLEEMVRNIGTARNNIRRGKMSVAGSGFRSSAFGRGGRMSGGPPSTPAADDSGDQLLSSIRSARNRGPPVRALAKDTSFDRADKHLELAHSMCENAAYQFLRTGDCSDELRGVKDKFKALLDLASGEVRRLQAEREHELASKERETPKVESVQLAVGPIGNKVPESTIGAIEVDDGTESDESLDLAAFRASRMRA
ncbi:hypothetical protein BDV25DRAFT_162294 [Aspergillus avenaceus]|uniref:Uncharacterized protein n=1 Tax=Aspergillus avenaceus TaxID=36643 RepID=A0A5N6TK79_ASPAV|nr:hypothetical protein BDV25DRAFT_162294 [Aspergillus avenaceus]